MRIPILAALLLPMVAGAQSGVDDTARPITLEEAVRMAQQNAPQAVQARGAIRSGESAVRSAFGSMLPSLSVSGSGQNQSGEQFQQGVLLPYRGSPWSFSRGIQSNLELFDGGRRLYNLRAARADVSAAEANERLQRFNVALSVKQQYYAGLAARESQAAARTQIEQAEQQLKASAARVAAGAATKSDSLRSVIQLQNARLALLTADNDLRVANASLTRLVATPFTVTPVVTDTSDVFVTSLDSAQLASYVASAPAVIQASADLNAARAARRAARTPYMPTLSVSFNMNGSNTSDAFDWGQGKYAYQKTLRFNVQYPLFNQFQREDNLVNMSVAETNAEAALRDARLEAHEQMVQFAGALSLAEERVAIQVTTVAAAEEDLRVQQQRYALGSSTLLDLLTSQTTLNQARTALIQARLDARVARAQIEALIGRDLR